MSRSRKQKSKSRRPQAQRYSQQPIAHRSHRGNPQVLAFLEQGIKCYQQGQYVQAVNYFQEALRLQDTHSEAWYLFGAASVQLGEYTKGINALKQAIALNPQEGSYYCHLGNAFQGQGDYEKAIECFIKAQQLKPNYLDAKFNLGNVFLLQSQYEKAIPLYQEASQLEPQNIAVLNNLGHAFQGAELYDEAIQTFEKILKLEPNNIDAYNHIGNVLQDRGEYEAALATYQQVLSVDPENAGGFNNLANTLQKLGQFEDSLQAYRRSIQLNPQDADARLNFALGLLLNGQFQEGWEEHEWRLKNAPVIPKTLSQTLWTGQADQQKILLWSEQGLGDSIQFVRYAPLLASQGFEVTVATRSPLVNLFKNSFEPNIKIINQDTDDLSGYQAHTSLMSLPRLFQTDLATIPQNIPYIAANQSIDPELKLPQSHQFNIGLVWASGKINPRLYKAKSISIEQFFQEQQDILQSKKVAFWSLQVGEDANEIFPFVNNETIYDLSNKLKDFIDTAQVIAQLDLVITVDTAVAHLAGAMGKPVWVLLPFVPDWRWLLQREDSPWYPSMQLFRQSERGNWQQVFSVVQRQIQQCLEYLNAVPVTNPKLEAVIPLEVITLPENFHQIQVNHFYEKGQQLKQQGQLPEAIAAYQQAIELTPNDPEIYNALGNALQEQGQLLEANRAFQQAVNLQPNSAELFFNLGNSWLLQGENEQAIAAYDQALQLDPHNRGSWNNRGHALIALERYEEAIASFQKILDLYPNDADSHNHIGNALQEQQKYAAAIAQFRQALDLKPEDLGIQYNLANALQQAGKFQAAIDHYRAILQKNPNDKSSHFNLGWVLLLTGNFDEGWNEYEWRFDPNKPQDKLLSTPMWRGEDLTHKHLLIWSEQGFGDSIQFARYVSLCLAKNPQIKQITLAARPSLVKLFRECLSPQVNVINQDQIEDASIYDSHIALMSLPSIFYTQEATIPHHTPYINTPTKILSHLRLPVTQSKKIGIVWGSSLTNPKMYKEKSINVGELISIHRDLLEEEQISFWSLQVGEDAEQIQPWVDHQHIFDLSILIKDFYDTAAIISQLDLVLTIDTAVAHLAGAMGKPVWVMLPHIPDWRWLLEREDSPWYPTMRLFRQASFGDWESVFVDIHEQLTAELLLEILANNQPSVDTPSIVQPTPTTTMTTNNALFYHNLGNELAQQGKISEAIANYYQAINAGNKDAELYNSLGNLLQNQNQLTDAAQIFQKATELDPNNANLFFNLGNVFFLQRLFDDAIAAYQQAVRLSPTHQGALNNLGHALAHQQKYDEAITTFKRILDFLPQDVDAHCHIGNIYHDLKDYESAIGSFQKALAINPNHITSLYNLGNAFHQSSQFANAVNVYQRVLALDPHNVAAQFNLGNSLQDLQQFDEAIAAYEKTLTLDPNNQGAHLNLGLLRLRLGDFQHGWADYEWRSSNNPPIQTPTWNGTISEISSLLLWSEQGMGDTIQFIRYAQLLEQQGIKITVATFPSLVKLLQQCFVGKIEVINQEEADLQQYEHHASLMSLPYLFKTNFQNIPCTIPYIQAPQVLSQDLQLSQDKSKKIGIVWASGIANESMYHNKSCDLALLFEAFQPFLNHTNISFWSLQVGQDAAQIQPWLSYRNVFDLSHKINDFFDTASIIAQLDLVISVDTAVAHLAGAMGKPVWTLLPCVADWRWLLNQVDSPWYPSMRLFRQEAHDRWQNTFNQVAENLKSFISQDLDFDFNNQLKVFQNPSQTKQKNLCISLISFFDGDTGYNIHSREFSNALEKAILNFDQHNSTQTEFFRVSIETEENLKYHEFVLNQRKESHNLVNICIGIGETCWEYLNRYPGIKIAYTVWESTKLPDPWIQYLTRCDYVWTASQWGRDVFIANGFAPEQVQAVPEGVNTNIFCPQRHQNEELLKISGFKFFTVGKCETRKSTEELIMAFDLEFHNDPNVLLVLACDNPFISKFSMEGFINNLWLRNYNKFIYINRGGSHGELASIMAACDCGVFPTKAEGWGLPIIEAMALGKPTIVTNYSAVTEYVTENNAILVDYHTIPIQITDLPFTRADRDYGTWALPNTSTLMQKMRDVYQNYSHYQQKFLQSSIQLRKDWSWEAGAIKALNLIHKLVNNSVNT